MPGRGDPWTAGRRTPCAHRRRLCAGRGGEHQRPLRVMALLLLSRGNPLTPMDLHAQVPLRPAAPSEGGRGAGFRPDVALPRVEPR